MNRLSPELETEKRRILQPLWNSFDEVLRPYLPSGIVLCVSGGLDSRALLEALARWPVVPQPNVTVLTVDHKVRSESEQEAKAVVARARVLGFEAASVTLLPVLKEDEATLRKQRYEAVWRFAENRNLQVVCTAHHLGDDAEGFMMDLFGLGGGHEGSSMESVLKTKNGLILRPLLGMSKNHLLSVLTLLDQVDYFVDPTNDFSLAKRTQVRSLLTKELAKLHPTAEQRFAGLAKRRGLDLQALYQVAGELIQVEEGETAFISVKAKTPEGLVWRAVMQGLKVLLPKQDFRSASNTVFMLVTKAKKIATTEIEGLDPRASSFTVDNKIHARFDLPGIRATVTKAGVRLTKVTDKSTFQAQDAVF